MNTVDNAIREAIKRFGIEAVKEAVNRQTKRRRGPRMRNDLRQLRSVREAAVVSRGAANQLMLKDAMGGGLAAYAAKLAKEADDTPLIAKLRKSLRDTQRENHRLKRGDASVQAATDPEPVV